MMKKNEKFISLILIICISLSMIGCKADNTKDDKKRDYIVYGVKSTDLNFKPFSGQMDEQEIYNALFDGFFEKNQKGDIIPVLFDSYKVSKDGLEYIFTLRNNARWSDGSSITCDDILNYFRQLLSYNNKNSFVSELFSIYGAKKYHEGNDDFSCVAITKENENTIKIRMNNKDEAFLEKLSSPRYRLVKKLGDLNKIKDNYKNIKYSGAYSIDAVNKDGTIMLKLNDGYHDNVENSPDKILLKRYESTELALADMEIGNVDFFKEAPESEVLRLYNNNKLQVYPKQDTIFLGFNLAKDRLTNSLNFRRAIQRGLSYSFYTYGGVKSGEYEVTKGQITRNTGQNKTALFTAGSISSDEIKSQIEDNVVVANKIIKENEDFKSAHLKILCENKYSSIAEFIKQKLEADLKFKVDIVDCNEGSLTEQKKKADYDMVLCSYDFHDEDKKDIYSSMFSGCSWNDEDFLKLSKKIESKKDYSTDNVEKMISDKIPYIPILFANDVVCKSEKISYINFDSNGIIELKKLEVKQ